jgi:hypothetical protein
MNFLSRPRSEIVLILNCWGGTGSKAPTLYVELSERGEEHVRVNCKGLLQKVGARVPSNRSMGVEIPIPYQLTVIQPAFDLR